MIDKPEAPSEVSDVDARFWLNEIEAAKGRRKDWYKAVEKATERYKDCDERAFGALNILWANVETQKAAIGSDFGKPSVSRINSNGNQALSRVVSSVLEQALSAAVSESKDNDQLTNAAHDVFLSGYGQVWQELNLITDEYGNISWVEAPIVRLLYDEYLEGLASRQSDVPWRARRHLFSLDDLRALDERNGTNNADKIKRDYKLPCGDEKDFDQKSRDQFKRAAVWEVWARFPTKRRLYVAEGYDTVLQVDADPYRLKGFYPCPYPLQVNSDESWQIPHTDYSRYEDQAVELDRVCKRIFVLLDTLRRRGVYDKRFPELMQMSEAKDNLYIPVENYTELQQKGGLSVAIQTEDLRPSIEILNSLYQQRDKLIALIYELSGISDLARGMTNPNETLGAQQLKKTYGSGRFQSRIKAVQHFAASAYAIKGELIAEHFDRDQIQEMSGVALPTFAERQQAQIQLNDIGQNAAAIPVMMDSADIEELRETANAPFTWEKISSVLQSDKRRCYMIDIETDQTSAVDEESDKQQRIAFVSEFNSLIQTFMPLIAANPANGDVFKRLIMFVLSRFKVGRAMEEGLERSIDNAIQKAVEQQAQPQAQQPADPVAQAQVALTQAQTQREMARIQTDAAKAQVDMQAAQVALNKSQAELAIKQAELQIKQNEVQAKVVGHQIDLQKKVDGQGQRTGFVQQTQNQPQTIYL